MGPADATPAPRAAPATRLPWWVGAVLLLLVWAGVAALVAHQRQLDEVRALDRAELLARVLADSANRNVEAAALAASTLGDLVTSGLSPAGAEVRLALSQTLVNLSFLRGIALVDARGRVLVSDDADAAGLTLDLSPLGPLPEAGQERLGPLVPARRIADLAMPRQVGGEGGGAPPAAVPAGVRFLPLLRRVQPPAGGEPLLVIVQINPQSFAAFQETLLGDAGANRAAAAADAAGDATAASAAALLSYEGRLIAGTSGLGLAPGALLNGLPPHTRFLPDLEHGRWTGDGLRGAQQLAAFRVAASRPLLVVVETQRSAVLAAARPRERSLLAAALAATALIISLAALWRRNARARVAAQGLLDRAQAEVARSERALSVTVESVQELIFRCGPDGRLGFVNERWQALTGLPAASAVGSRLAERAPPAHQRALEMLFQPGAAGGLRRVQAPLLAHDGSERQFEIAVLPLQQDDRVVGFAGSAVDVTALLQAQRALQVQLAFTRQLMDVSPLPVSVVGLDRRYLLVNRAWEAFTGRSRAQVIGTLVGAHLSPDEQAVHEAKDQLLLASGQAMRYEATARHQDGSRRDVQVDKLLLPGPDGEPAGILAVLVDVTEFRNAERATRQARDAAESASRTKSEFIANMSHELRTPLQAIIGFSELGQLRAQNPGADPERLAAMFNHIGSAGQRMLALVNDLLDLAKIESLLGAVKLLPTDLRPLAHAVVQELQPLLLQRQQRVVVQAADDALPAPIALADAPRLQQVLRNLLANAIKFGPEGSEIGLQIERRAPAVGADASLVAVVVTDHGPGVPPAELEAIFEAFVQSSTTKDGSGGTGLGLAICRRIVVAHGGTIAARNRAGGGALFEVLLPAATH